MCTISYVAPLTFLRMKSHAVGDIKSHFYFIKK